MKSFRQFVTELQSMGDGAEVAIGHVLAKLGQKPWTKAKDGSAGTWSVQYGVDRRATAKLLHFASTDGTATFAVDVGNRFFSVRVRNGSVVS